MQSEMPCPCGSRRPCRTCCGAIHDGLVVAADAETLMRSRYSAYVLGREDWLLASWHASTRPAHLALSAADTIEWLKLRVLEHVATGPQRAEVSFEARFIERGRHGVMRERSRFVHEDGRWWYVDGDVD